MQGTAGLIPKLPPALSKTSVDRAFTKNKYGPISSGYRTYRSGHLRHALPLNQQNKPQGQSLASVILFLWKTSATALPEPFWVNSPDFSINSSSYRLLQLLPNWLHRQRLYRLQRESVFWTRLSKATGNNCFNVYGIGYAAKAGSSIPVTVHWLYIRNSDSSTAPFITSSDPELGFAVPNQNHSILHCSGKIIFG